jgi:hypothetical protein
MGVLPVLPHPAANVKTTIELSDELLRRAKQAALDRGVTLKAVVEEALERHLGVAAEPVRPFRMVTFGGQPADGSAPAFAALRSGRADPHGLDQPARLRRRLGVVPGPASTAK